MPNGRLIILPINIFGKLIMVIKGHYIVHMTVITADIMLTDIIAG